jgi:hypothetical protein
LSQSIQSAILDAVVATLGGEEQSVYRCRFTDFSAAELVGGADNVIPEDELPDYDTTGDTELRHKFFVRHTMQAADAVDKAVDPRFVRAYQLLLADPTQGGLVKFTWYRGRKWEFEKGELDTVALVVTYEVEFSTKRSDPSQPGY